MLLSIVTPTMPGRERLLSRLLHGLGEQMCDDVEVLILGGDGPMGDKVNAGLEAAAGVWSVIVDDDDEVAADYVDTVCAAVDDGPDFVGYRIVSLVDGAFSQLITHRLGGDPLWVRSPRGPGPKCPIRTSIGRRHSFGNEYTADRPWSTAVAAELSSGVFVDRVLYRHDYWSLPRPDVGLWPYPAGAFRWL